MGDLELRTYRFRGGPLDGRSLEIPVTDNPEWSIPTVDGVWVADRSDSLPEDISEADYRHETYIRVGDDDEAEYVHSTLLEERPEGWPEGRPL